jgi:glycosyltransferase involved in cell wall biosynthesis
MLREALAPLAGLARASRAHARGLSAYLAGAPEGRDIRVNYGVRVPAEHEHAVGGIVKLQHLAKRYPGSSRAFNILYLVSSRLPDAPLVVADWAARTGSKLVINQNGVAYPAWHGEGWERENAPMAALLARADHVFYQSDFCRISADRFAGQPAGAWEVLHNPVDTARFTPRRATSTARTLTLLLGGSQDQWYRFESAVRTLAVLVDGGVDCALLVTGRRKWEADSPAATPDLLSSLRVTDRVELLGPYSQEQAPAIFNRADILLHTKYNDPCPTVVLEGLASGLPVVYSKSGGVPELVGEGGIGVDCELSWDRDIPPNPTELANAVCTIQASLRQYSEAARTRAVERFDVSRWLARHDEVFASLTA